MMVQRGAQCRTATIALTTTRFVGSSAKSCSTVICPVTTPQPSGARRPAPFGAPADGSEICVVCEIRSARGQLVIGGGPRTGEHHQSMPFHVACFEVWNDERRAPKTWL